MLSERPITRNEIIVRARVVGGLQMIDSGEADDKIIAVLENDNVWGTARDIERRAGGADRAAAALLSDLQAGAGRAQRRPHGQGLRAGARPQVVRAAMADYAKAFPEK